MMDELLTIQVCSDDPPGWKWIALEKFNPEVHTVYPVTKQNTSPPKSPIVLGAHDVNC